MTELCWEHEEDIKREISYQNDKLRHIVSQEMFLLENALIALKKGKTHITEDHLERVIFNLKRVCRC